MSVYVINDPKGTGKFCVKINIDGRRKQITVESKELADAVVRKIKAQIELGKFQMDDSADKDKREIPTVDEYTESAIDKMYPAARFAATNERYHSVRKKDIRGKGKLGEKRLDKVDTLMIWNFINSLVDDGRTRSSIDLTRTVLHCCFKMARLEKLIETNPMTDLPRKKNEEHDADAEEMPFKINPFTEEQMITFLDAAMEVSPRLYGPLFLCGFRTGMRLGEILAMRWEHIDWDRGVIVVFRGYRRSKLGKTKTRKVREVDMSKQLQELMHARYTECLAKAKIKGQELQQIIFHCRGTYRSQNTTRNAFKKILKSAGLPDKRVHDMRHTFASVLLSKGATINYIKDQLGHSKISTTSDLYARFIPGTNRDTISLLDSPIGVCKTLRLV